MGIKCFYIVPTDQVELSLRRFTYDDIGCSHDASTYIETVSRAQADTATVDQYLNDPRWPTTCEKCGYQFQPTDCRQIFQSQIYQDSATGEKKPFRQFTAIPGCIWNMPWLAEWHHGPDGLSLCCTLPGGHPWSIDGVARNCDSTCKVCGRPYHSHTVQDHTFTDARPHQCWVRHGVPPNLTVDKNGVTCGAGAGSIISPNGWHGFLRNGELV